MKKYHIIKQQSGVGQTKKKLEKKRLRFTYSPNILSKVHTKNILS